MNIRVDLNKPIKDGAEVVFRSPVDCSQITGLIVYYRENGNTAYKEFAFADANGNDVGNIDHLFGENAVVKVILDLDTSMAFVQNADTNAYLERRLNSCAGAIVCEASGEVISIADASNGKLFGLTVYGKTTQNGTPSPENPVPLESAGDSGSIGVTVAGKNLLPYPYNETTKTINGITYTDNGDGTITASGTSTASASIYLARDFGLMPGTYIASVNAVSGVYLSIYKNNAWMADVASANTFTVEQGDRLTAYIQVTSGKTVNAVLKPMIRDASVTDDSYEHYKNAQTLTIQTPNGLNGIGEVKDVVDCANGVRVNRFGFEDIGTLNWSTGNLTNDGTGAFICQIADMAPGALLLTSKFNCRNDVTDWQRLTDGEMTSVSNYAVCATKDYTDVATFKSAMSGVMLIYELAEPIVTPLSAEELAQYSTLHTNKPNTTVFNDAGAEMAVSYVADTKTFFMNEIGKLAAAIVNNA